ncbi:Ribonuclease H domain [Macleaya cordata]|uniref:Ribonuclease H domain n=1 Tax=Macleaya cordata TaxID=56857 RepID=A0A200PXG2_MACCD|nr:Ribonuclease H domain [Macleaya cordata]
MRVLNRCSIEGRPVKHLLVHQCFWIKPEPGQLNICCDGSSVGNPGISGMWWFFVITMGTNYAAELPAVIGGIEEALLRGWNNLWVVSDSKVVVESFSTNSVSGNQLLG